MIAIMHSIYSQSVHAPARDAGLMDNDAEQYCITAHLISAYISFEQLKTMEPPEITLHLPENISIYVNKNYHRKQLTPISLPNKSTSPRKILHLHIEMKIKLNTSEIIVHPRSENFDK